VWPIEACRLAAEVDADCFVVETNFGGDQATTLIRQAWVELIRRGEVAENRLCPRVKAVRSKVNKVLRAEPIAAAVQLDRFRFAPGLNQLVTEWTLWEPGSTWSPGALDAAVHLATEILPPIPQGSNVTSVAGRSRQTASVGGLTAARLRR
jgi:phage terminase large subunit-like protein